MPLIPTLIRFFTILLFIFFSNSCTQKRKSRSSIPKEISSSLDSVGKLDQLFRITLDSLQKNLKWGSPEIKKTWEQIASIDSTNIKFILKIIDEYGWLAKSDVGESASLSLFLVVQHADLSVQEKVLPILKLAVQKGNAEKQQLALLEDRILIRNGKKQLYGTQLGMDIKHKQFYLSPTQDPDNLDNRRRKMNLSPIKDYLKDWKLEWKLEEYKKDLPRLEKLQETVKNI